MEITQELIREITDVLRTLGSTRPSRGRFRTVAAIALACEKEDRLTAVTNEIYRAVAREHGCQWSAVERNVRTVANRAWNQRKERLTEVAGYTVDGPPSAGEFMEIVVSYLQRTAPDLQRDGERA